MAITLHTDTVELPEQTELVQGRHRDAFQREIDGDVLIMKHATAAAGWPEPDPTKHFLRYVVGPDDATEMKSVIRRAATLHKLDPQFYKDGKTEAGHVVIKFHVTRATSPAKPEVYKETPNHRRVMEGDKPAVDTNDVPLVYAKDDSLGEDGKPTADFNEAVKSLKAARKPS
jgi:hypothetical protein